MQIKVQQPNPRQEEFFQARERFVAYGGARGGGKSWALRRKLLLLGVRYPGIRMLLLRRTYPELRDNHILPLQRELQGLAVYKESAKRFLFLPVEGKQSVLNLGYCANDGDVNQYQGQEYDIIAMDEATQFSEYQYSVLTACLRGVNDFPKRMYLTCNPGGVGHAWVKRLFVDREYRQDERGEDYRFIPARVYDNKVLLEHSPDYVQMLKNLPEKVRAAWLEGNWDAMAGQYFDMWDRSVHVVRPFAIPRHWRRYVSMDYGRDMFACYFAAMDEAENCFVYREIYEPGLLVAEAAERLLEKLSGEEEIESFLAPPDLWNKHSDTGRSTADIFADFGIYLTRANNDRVQGWYDLAEWLRVLEDEQGRKTARLRVFANCGNLIRTLPQLQYDEKRPNDCAKEPHELTHGPDAIRYLVAGRPYRADLPKEEADEEILAGQDDVDGYLSFGI